MKDKKFLLGLGVGIIISTLLIFKSSYSYSISDAQVEKRALEMGMIYKDNQKVKIDEVKK
ncbi:hypothetical protein [Hathewaya limosa]|uniref:MFS superfamily sulfate permease-like transporter n=1 Tax=Hathewaya limosa TaxID=1536 RepID=A0ABU0JSQ3_HATLI|nr:hypothetical protein [Hathewaya limosa]MDQ0479276.1 MFS superfamily sulfate permease-like transporter [Hathewaya limosa]